MVLRFLFLFILVPFVCFSQSAEKADEPEDDKWYDKFSIRGYVQTRYNRLFESNPLLKCEQCDKSIGEGGGFFLRRARIILSGQLNNHVYFYFQPDFASSVDDNGLNFAQIRDAYVDLSIGKGREFRLRVGQSKIPFGFENMQSSSDRLPLDRNDALNSSFANERDIGGFFYYAPANVRTLWQELSDKELKPSGDYGVLGFGMFNGQGANQPEANDNLYKVVRLSYPFQLGEQIIEPGIQAYTGKFTIVEGQLNNGTKLLPNSTYTDERIAASFILYPQPFGIQAEYNVGKGPEYDAATDSVMSKDLTGGYATLSYMTKAGSHIITPFLRGQYYRGGKKFESDARAYQVHEYEAGIEWQPMKYFELVAMYTFSQRWTSDGLNENNLQNGSMLRLQAQLNF